MSYCAAALGAERSVSLPHDLTAHPGANRLMVAERNPPMEVPQPVQSGTGARTHSFNACARVVANGIVN